MSFLNAVNDSSSPRFFRVPLRPAKASQLTLSAPDIVYYTSLSLRKRTFTARELLGEKRANGEPLVTNVMRAFELVVECVGTELALLQCRKVRTFRLLVGRL